MSIISKTKINDKEILKNFSLDKKEKNFVLRQRKEIKDILSSKDRRLIVIVGPCSAWPYDATVEYALKIKKIEESTNDKLKIVLRVYTQKPRTQKGWTGVINQPDPFSEPNIKKGALYARGLMKKITSFELPIADEVLFTHKLKWIEEYLSWVAIGARSSEDQEHRVLASSLDIPVGMKNPTSGFLDIGVNSVVSAQSSHCFYLDGYQVKTSGNKFAHLVLRGGKTGPNFQIKFINEAEKLFLKNKVKNPSIIIDASHDNSKKDPKKQIDVVKKTLLNIKKEKSAKKLIKGFLIESFLKEGRQDIKKLNKNTVNRNGLSITDPCLGFEKTKKLIEFIYKSL